jgi:hypothetical protein
MKINMEFNLDREDDEKKLGRMLRSKDLCSALFEILNNVPKKAKKEAESLEADSDPADGIYVMERLIKDTLNKYSLDVDTIEGYLEK